MADKLTIEISKNSNKYEYYLDKRYYKDIDIKITNNIGREIYIHKINIVVDGRIKEYPLFEILSINPHENITIPYHNIYSNLKVDGYLSYDFYVEIITSPIEFKPKFNLDEQSMIAQLLSFDNYIAFNEDGILDKKIETFKSNSINISNEQI